MFYPYRRGDLINDLMDDFRGQCPDQGQLTNEILMKAENDVHSVGKT